jgi:hypothetical protein
MGADATPAAFPPLWILANAFLPKWAPALKNSCHDYFAKTIFAFVEDKGATCACHYKSSITCMIFLVKNYY